MSSQVSHCSNRSIQNPIGDIVSPLHQPVMLLIFTRSSITIVHCFFAFDYGMHKALNSSQSSHVQNLTCPCKPIQLQSRFYRGTFGQLISSKRMTTLLTNQVRLPDSTLCAWPSHIQYVSDMMGQSESFRAQPCHVNNILVAEGG